jgi:phospholipase C
VIEKVKNEGYKSQLNVKLKQVRIMRAIEFLSVLLIIAMAPPSANAKPPLFFKHIIVIIQENRTPDNLFGSNTRFEPGVDIASSGVNSHGVTIPLTAIQLNDCYDLGHFHGDFEAMYDGGRMDGADKVHFYAPPPSCTAPPNPQFKYVDNSTGTVQPYFDIATQYGWANRMFSTQQGPSQPAHLFLFGGTSAPTTDSDLFVSENQTPQPGNAPTGCLSDPGVTIPLIDPAGSETSNPPIYPCFQHPTLSDLLDHAHISWKWYAPNGIGFLEVPNSIKHICRAQTVNGVLKCTGPDWANGRISVPQTNILTDIHNCKLPQVSWVIPTAAESDHAGSDSGLGPSWVASIVNQVGNNPACAGTGEVYWKNTAILVTWDDWGGWYDHVAPYRIGQSNNWGVSYVYGFRVPLLVMSAYTPPGYVDNSNHDFGSILRFIEYNLKLSLIGPGFYADAYADNLAPFFTLPSARPFVTIAALFDAQHFLLHPLPLEDPDDD